MIRYPAVAGRFYSAEPDILRQEVMKYVTDDENRTDAKAIISPHAGFVYSGHVAGAVYSRINIPKRIVIIGPNHTGAGHPCSLMDHGEWVMPMGNVAIDSDLAKRLLTEASCLTPDSNAHIYEHSLEVQLPFIQYFRSDISILPLCLGPLPYELCVELGIALSKVMTQDTLIVASSDMSHYEPQKEAEQKDRLAISHIERLDPEGLYNTVRSMNISPS
jgi:AmmeMemoRadiSam system protein B